jgi:hypothetical protein
VKKNNLLREPLLHFFVLGLLLFVLYGLVNDESGRSAEEIVVDQTRVAGMVATFEKTWRRPPTESELQGLIDAWVREEILYREGVAVGFDLNDPIIRRRVAQKMSFIADGMVPQTPTDEELDAWLRENIDDYQIPARYTFRQVYIDPQRHPDDLDAVMKDTEDALLEGVDPVSLGDASLLIDTVSDAAADDVIRVFGTEFADALREVTVGSWQGPIRSGYGLHFVLLGAFEPSRDPMLDDVRAAVERDLLSDKSREINEAFYEALRERYTVRIEQSETGS